MKATAMPNNSLSQWLNQQAVEEHLATIALRLALSCVSIADAIQEAAMDTNNASTGTINIQGEEQKALDIISNDIVLAELKDLAQIAACVSEEIDELILNPDAADAAPYAVCFDPLDGSSNIETNSSIGTIFSVLQLTKYATPVSQTDVLAAANNQILAGYVLYGPTTILVLTCGKSVASFVLDPEIKQFVLSDSDLKVPEKGAEFAINMAYERFWEPAISTYVSQCLAGRTGPRGTDYGMRWMGAMVADVHRLFIRGGIFIYPSLSKPGSENGKLRFLYEANPMAMLVEVAGGKALMRNTRIMDFPPTSLHQRVSVVLGSSEEVDYLGALY